MRKIRKIYNNFEKILNCHNSGCMQDRVVIFDSRVGFSGTGYLMALFKLTPGLPLLPWQRNLGQPTPVAMATKFGTKSTITRLI